MSLHPTAAAGFAASPETYERGRPGYPAAALEYLREKLGLREGTTVVDLAAGTGKLTRALATTGARLIAVEPVAEMRGAIGSAIETLEGTADAMPLAEASADALTVAQAFHWFANEAALAEIHRVVRPGGRVALLWNTRQMDDAVHQRIEDLIAPYCGAVPRHRTVAWRDVFSGQSRFGPFEEATFANEQVVDAEGLAARVGSISAIAALSEREHEVLLTHVRALAREGTVTLRYACEVHVAERLRG